MKFFDFLEQNLRKSESTFIYSPGLSFITMSEELLIEAFKRNKFYGSVKDELLKLHSNIQAIISKQNGANFLIHLCLYDGIVDMLVKDEYVFEELSVISGKKIILPHDICVRHLQYTIELLKEQENYFLGFIYTQSSSNNTFCSCYCMKNQCFISGKNMIRYHKEVNLVNAASDLFNNEWNNIMPDEYKEKQHVINKLQKLLDRYNR